MWTRIKNLFKKYFLTGFLILLPGIVTLMVVYWLARWIAGLLSFGIIPTLINSYMPLPEKPEVLHRLIEAGLQTVDFILGLVILLIITLATGAFARTYFLRKAGGFAERLLAQIPGAGFIYNATRELLNSIFSDQDKKFSRVVLTEYPSKGSWVIGLVSGNSGELFDRAVGEKMVNIFIPTTPNPTNGFLLVVPESSIKELDLSVPEAFKMVISGGMTEIKGKSR